MFQSKPHRMPPSSNRMYIHGEHTPVTNLHNIAITSCANCSLPEPFLHVVWCGHEMALLVNAVEYFKYRYISRTNSTNSCYYECTSRDQPRTKTFSKAYAPNSGLAWSICLGMSMSILWEHSKEANTDAIHH